MTTHQITALEGMTWKEWYNSEYCKETDKNYINVGALVNVRVENNGSVYWGSLMIGNELISSTDKISDTVDRINGYEI